LEKAVIWTAILPHLCAATGRKPFPLIGLGDPFAWYLIGPADVSDVEIGIAQRNHENPMMRIRTWRSGGVFTIQIEGRLAGAWVPELEECWRSAKVSNPNDKVVVDLSCVTGLDASGGYLLQLMHRCEVDFVGANLTVRELLDRNS
jgi:hypothetical protein